MASPEETNPTADTSANWRSATDAADHRRDAPPHLAPGPTPPGDGPTFLSARSQPDTRTASPNSEEHASTADRTASPDAPSGLTASLAVDANGRRYLRESSTGLRIDFDLSDAELLGMGTPSVDATPAGDTKESTSVSDASDLTPDSVPSSRPEALIDALINGIDPTQLSAAQQGLIHTFKGALTTGRSRLLNTTAVVLEQRKTAQVTREALIKFREEIADRFQSFAEAVDSDHAQMEDTIKENVRVLIELGETEANIERLLNAMGATGVKTQPQPVLPVLAAPPSVLIGVPLMQEIHKALPPRQPHESVTDFERRAQSSAASKKRASAAFPVDIRPPVGDFAPPIKMARFEEFESISSAPRYRQQAAESMSAIGGPGIGPSLSRMDLSPSVGASPVDLLAEFNAEAERIIRALITRQVGQSLDDLPSRLRAPKLEPPPKYGGENDHVKFMDWLEVVCTWMRASFMGGPGSADNYRITVIKTLLTTSALQWFTDYVETRSGQSLIQYDFESVICALHRRFVTAATAQKASREFDAVRYNPDSGPLKLMDELIDCSGRLREPMPDFIIRQRFMRLLPDAISGTMSLHRALSAEYSDIAQLRSHSHQIWDYFNTEKLRSHRTRLAVTVAPLVPAPVARTSPLPKRETPRIGSQPSTPNPTPGQNGPNANKRCFRCGLMGHIGTDKICAKNLERPRVGVAAQRVPEAYAEDDYIVVDDAHAELVTDDHWGGSQYDPEYAPPEDLDPNVAPDLADLIELEDATEARIGAMRLGSYSMRIEPTIPGGTVSGTALVSRAVLTDVQSLLAQVSDDLTVTAADRNIDELYGPSALIDMSRLGYTHELQGDPEFTAEEYSNLHRALVTEHEYPITEQTSFSESLFLFQVEHEDRMDSVTDSIDWKVLLALGAAERNREELRTALSLPLEEDISVSTKTLAGPTDALMDEGAAFVSHIADTRAALHSTVMARATARTIAEELPLPGEGVIHQRTLALRYLVLRITQAVSDEAGTTEAALDKRILHLLSLQSALLDEISRRTTASPETTEHTHVDAKGDEIAIRANRVLGFHDQEDLTNDQMRWTYGDDVVGASIIEDSEEDWMPADGLDPGENTTPTDAGLNGIPAPRSESSDSDEESRSEDSDSHLSEYQIEDARRPPAEPRDDDELVIRSVRMLMGTDTAELCLIYKDHAGVLYVKVSPLPANHYLSPEMRGLHLAAMDEAIRERAEELGWNQARVGGTVNWAERTRGNQDRRGYIDTSPRLLPGELYHERVASEDPDADDETYYPGFRVQSILAQRVEHIANVNRPDAVPRIGITDPPSRNIRDIACLTAELNIGGSKAYMLFDSGSNTDSLTPEFARASQCKTFKLDEQVTLQLGCVGSRSRINFGARAPIDFGGIKGHSYFDLVNLDRYDGIIGTPFMIKHKLVLDFGTREIRFPNGQVIAALSIMDDLSLVRARLAISDAAPPRRK
ncbi:hypothetical protein B0H15DRAFT_944277 [Mycena belliarum]|uniref:Uncharacterized protein n=1 Tax=Mycena belliarum TaxID=1033014 RepID=A0AAD6UEC9_9AGAR|nr:hypothetical protein B0H15DRAFT_944277 [Mycena belliae]